MQAHSLTLVLRLLECLLLCDSDNGHSWVWGYLPLELIWDGDFDSNDADIMWCVCVYSQQGWCNLRGIISLAEIDLTRSYDSE